MNRSTAESAPFRRLSIAARAAYIEVRLLYFGSNNGAISISARHLVAERLGIGKTAAAAALKELVESGIVEITTQASWGEAPRAATYRLVDRKCDVSGMRANQKSNVVLFPVPSGTKPKAKAANSTA